MQNNRGCERRLSTTWSMVSGQEPSDSGSFLLLTARQALRRIHDEILRQTHHGSETREIARLVRKRVPTTAIWLSIGETRTCCRSVECMSRGTEGEGWFRVAADATRPSEKCPPDICEFTTATLWCWPAGAFITRPTYKCLLIQSRHQMVTVLNKEQRALKRLTSLKEP